MVTAELQTASVAYSQRKIHLSGFSARPDGSLFQLIRTDGFLLYCRTTFCGNLNLCTVVVFIHCTYKLKCLSDVYWTCIIVIVEELKTNLMSLAILFHFLCAQHVSDINISIIRSLRLCWRITTSFVLFSVRCVLDLWCGWFWVVLVLQAEASKTSTTQNQPHQISNTQRTENKTTDVVIHQHSRKLLMMDILMSETCWAHKKWNKIASDIKLVFHS
jgi:hypothetical protein